MISVRQIAACLFLSPGLVPDGFKWSGKISIVQDLFGYAKVPQQLSLLQLTGLLTRKHIHLNLIRVGSDLFTDDDEAEIDLAVHIMRLIYAQVDLGIGRIDHYFIPVAQTGGWEIIESDEEAEALTDEWTFPKDSIDVFFVQAYAGGTVGHTTINAPCNKDETDAMTGVVVAIEHTPIITGITLAHEIGHHLGLWHEGDSNNVMHPNVGTLGMFLTTEQGERMKKHCFIRTGCRSI